jgi:hypothetical protein
MHNFEYILELSFPNITHGPLTTIALKKKKKKKQSNKGKVLLALVCIKVTHINFKSTVSGSDDGVLHARLLTFRILSAV